jgi:hypothetical protein
MTFHTTGGLKRLRLGITSGLRVVISANTCAFIDLLPYDTSSNCRCGAYNRTRLLKFMPTRIPGSAMRVRKYPDSSFSRILAYRKIFDAREGVGCLGDKFLSLPRTTLFSTFPSTNPTVAPVVFSES